MRTHWRPAGPGSRQVHDTHAGLTEQSGIYALVSNCALSRRDLHAAHADVYLAMEALNFSRYLVEHSRIKTNFVVELANAV